MTNRGRLLALLALSGAASAGVAPERFPVRRNHLTTRQNAANEESSAFPDPVRSGNALASGVYYRPSSANAERAGQDGVEIIAPVATGGRVAIYDVALRWAGIPAKIRVDCDENDEVCRYKIAYNGIILHYKSDSSVWSASFDNKLHVYILEDSLNDVLYKNYLTKIYAFHIIDFSDRGAFQRACVIMPGEKLGIAKAGTGADSFMSVLDGLAPRLADGWLSARDYRCGARSRVLSPGHARYGIKH